MLPLRGVDCALHEAFGRLVGIECGIALIAELVVLDLFNEWVRRINHLLQTERQLTLNSLGVVTWSPHLRASSSIVQGPLLDLRVKVSSAILPHCQSCNIATDDDQVTNLTLSQHGR